MLVQVLGATFNFELIAQAVHVLNVQVVVLKVIFYSVVCLHIFGLPVKVIQFKT